MKTEDRIETHFTRLAPAQKAALSKLGIRTIRDLLYHFPSRYIDSSQIKYIGELKAGDSAILYGKLSRLKISKAFRKKIAMAEAVLEDETGKIKIVWFHQPYIAKMIREDSLAELQGKVGERRGELYLSNPETKLVGKIPDKTGDSLFGTGEKTKNISLAVYPESRGLSSLWLRHAVGKVLKSGILSTLEDPIPDEILKRYNLPTFKTSLVWIHSPKKAGNASAARKRFAFEEVFFIQLEKQKLRQSYRESRSYKIKKTPSEIAEFVKRFPFGATKAQEKAIADIMDDIGKPHPMSRLLEGDVGSGKTAVAASALYGVVTTRPEGQSYGALQGAYMAPTEILARQHFESFIKYFYHTGIQIGLITGAGCRKFPSKVSPHSWTDISRSQLLKWVAGGEIAILVGTHALIQKTVRFQNLAFIVIDEQHRFGTAQRQKLARKEDILPHLLSMTATPIPRTLALTVYGDLDLSLLDEMPEGRRPIITEIARKDKRDEMYGKIKKELKAGRQLYVICPRINEPDPAKEMAVIAKSVKEEAKHLKKDIFKDYEIGIIHSKMKPKDKEAAMIDFAEGRTQILVATSVVEVGVNVPNATVIIIEGAERFGLAQLHQLRGRVLRSNHQAYCYLLAESAGGKTADRLKAVLKAKNGFELAEEDLKLRGAGELYGGRQWGISDIGMEALKNLKMVEAARKEAQNLIKDDKTFKKYPLIKERLENKKAEIHFE